MSSRKCSRPCIIYYKQTYKPLAKIYMPPADSRPLDDPEPPMKPVPPESSNSDQYELLKVSDDSSNKAKIGGGIAGTAIGAGAIGGGSYYASGAVGLVSWLI